MLGRALDLELLSCEQPANAESGRHDLATLFHTSTFTVNLCLLCHKKAHCLPISVLYLRVTRVGEVDHCVELITRSVVEAMVYLSSWQRTAAWLHNAISYTSSLARSVTSQSMLLTAIR